MHALSPPGWATRSSRCAISGRPRRPTRGHRRRERRWGHIAALGEFGRRRCLALPACLARRRPCLDPRLPPSWQRFGFRVHWRGRVVRIHIDQETDEISATPIAGSPMRFALNRARAHTSAGRYALPACRRFARRFLIGRWTAGGLDRLRAVILPICHATNHDNCGLAAARSGRVVRGRCGARPGTETRKGNPCGRIRAPGEARRVSGGP